MHLMESTMKTTINASLLRPASCLLFAALTGLLSSTASADEFPHAYPRTGVTSLFENERVFAWDVHWIHDIEQPYHRHRYDMAGVYLRYGPIRVTALDGTVSPISPPFDIPRPYFQREGVTHKEEMIGFAPDAPERWAIMFDLKNVTGKVAKVPPGMTAAFPQDGAEMAIDNDRVMEWVHAWEIGKPLATHMHNIDSVQVFYSPGTLRFTDANGNSRTQDFVIGDARFIPAGTIDTEEAVSGAPKAVTIEIK